MGVTKTEKFTGHQNAVAALAKALGHPARVAIVEHLLDVNACICGELVDVLPLAQPTISQHLKELKNAGVIQGEVEGTSVCYCLNPTVIGRLHGYLEEMVDRLKSRGEACC